MNEWVKEYGRICFAVAECAIVVGVIAALCMRIAVYMEYFADSMMGG